MDPKEFTEVPTETPAKDIVDLTVYQINGNTELRVYTATWCGPCTRIKPVLTDIMSRGHKYSISEQRQVLKAEFKNKVSDYVPFFQFVNFEWVPDSEYNNRPPPKFLDKRYKKDYKSFGPSIQTSDAVVLTAFLVENSIIVNLITEDF
jgi:hypothetical protein